MGFSSIPYLKSMYKQFMGPKPQAAPRPPAPPTQQAQRPVDPMQATVQRVAAALQRQGILTPNTLAYALATIEHETAGTFKPIEEYGGREQARKLGYSGGENYYGRGYIQLTHDYNYKDMGQKIGKDLYNNPSLALDPDISAEILARYFKDRGVTNYTDKGDFYNARRPINSLDRAGEIQKKAQNYATKIQKGEYTY